MTRGDTQDQLKLPYDTDRWLTFLHAVLPGTDIFGNPQPVAIDHKFARRVSQLGRVRLKGDRHLAVLEIEVSDHVDIVRNRVGLRNFVARFIDQERAHGVLAVFLSPEADYRLTFAAKESVLTDDGTLATNETATRRFTYVLGPNEPCRTPAERFNDLAEKGGEATLDDVIAAFSVEKLNREFFDTYKAHYQKFCAHLLDGDAPAKAFGIQLKGLDAKARDFALKPVRDFVKKLLGRLVFLHFLQKKGWLGCPAKANDWKNGDASFLRNLFEKASAVEQQHFHSRRLVPLFFDTLNRQRKGDLFAITGTRVPYLNGGLFERDFDNVEQIDFPAELFRDLLEFFGQYNFTIDENDPDDHEIGIDPEMLGHIFENLLEDNKDKGAFYTPKAIVQYMCQQSLICYLKQHLGDRSDIETLVRSKDVGDPADKQNWIRQNAKQIEKLLDEVKICDPAIGSGAFPIGLLQEIYWIKLSLDWTLDRATAKRDIIQHSIYGVDIDAGAVEIARLRFWLALVVEENTPRPLPNLDYKIMQGNSLLESFEGIDLSNLTGKKRQTVQLLGTEQTELGLKAVSTELTVEFAEGKQAEIGKLINDYFDQDDHEQKQKLHRQIDELVLGHIEYNLDLHEERTQAVLDNARKEIKRKQAAARGYQPTKKEAERIAELEAQLAEVDRKRDELAKLQEKPERPFFLWHLFFQDVFTHGGFDIVIANPPYVRQEALSEFKPDFQRCYQSFDSAADLYVYFIELGVRMLRAGGILTYITSNSFFRTGYGEALRRFLKSQCAVCRIVDFGGVPVFASAKDTYVCIPVLVKATKQEQVEVCRMPSFAIRDLGAYVEANRLMIPPERLADEAWSLKSDVEAALIERVMKAGKPLGDYVERKMFYGIKTGLNNAFELSDADRAAILAETPASSLLIKPFLGGQDVRRYYVENNKRFLIVIPCGWTRTHLAAGEKGNRVIPEKEAFDWLAHEHPAVARHLLRFAAPLKKRQDQGDYWWELRPCDYYPHLDAPKIVFPDICKAPRFALDRTGIYLANTAYCLGSDSLYLLGILNSRLFWFAIGNISIPFGIRAGQYRYRLIYQYMEKVPIRVINFAEPAEKAAHDAIVSLVEQVLAAKRASPLTDTESLESEIDAHVYRLYGLTPEEIALVQATRIEVVPTVAKGTLFTHVLPQLKEAFPYFTTEAIVRRVRELGLEIKEATLPVYLTEATASGLIHDAGRGWYSRLSERVPLDSKPVAKLIRAVEKAFPLLEFTVWSTAQINPWMHHLLAQPVAFLHAPADTLESVGDTLRAQGWEVAVNPTPSSGPKSVRPGEKMVVLRPTLAKEPASQGRQDAIEKVLVDLLVEAQRLSLMDQSEAEGVVRDILSRYLVQMAEMQSYAKFRKLKSGVFK